MRKRGCRGSTEGGRRDKWRASRRRGKVRAVGLEVGVPRGGSWRGGREVGKGGYGRCGSPGRQLPSIIAWPRPVDHDAIFPLHTTVNEMLRVEGVIVAQTFRDSRTGRKRVARVVGGEKEK